MAVSLASTAPRIAPAQNSPARSSGVDLQGGRGLSGLARQCHLPRPTTSPKPRRGPSLPDRQASRRFERKISNGVVQTAFLRGIRSTCLQAGTLPFRNDLFPRPLSAFQTQPRRLRNSSLPGLRTYPCIPNAQVILAHGYSRLCSRSYGLDTGQHDFGHRDRPPWPAHCLIQAAQ